MTNCTIFAGLTSHIREFKSIEKPSISFIDGNLFVGNSSLPGGGSKCTIYTLHHLITFFTFHINSSPSHISSFIPILFHYRYTSINNVAVCENLVYFISRRGNKVKGDSQT